MSLLSTKRLDAILRLFDGDISLTELVHMDLPSQRALIQSRIDNLKESQTNFENGKLDSFSRRYASVMGGFLQQKPNIQEKAESERSKGAQNLRALANENQSQQ